MGDRRFESSYERLRGKDTVHVLATMTDEEVVSALAASSRAHDPYLANVLATAAHNRLRRSTAVIDNIGEGLCALDTRGVIVQANPAAASLLGIPQADLLGREFHALVHAHYGPAHSQPDECELERLVLAEVSTRAEEWFASPRGAFPVAITVSPVLIDDDVEGHVVLFQDIAERKRSADTLERQARVLESTIERSVEEIERRAEAEALFRELFEASPDPVVVTDATDRIVLLNGRAQQAFGTSDDLVGQPASVLLDANGSGRPAEWGLVEQSRVVTARRRDGGTFRAEVATSSVARSGGRLRLTTLRDITARWRAEERLKRNEAMLKDAESLARLGSWEWDLATGEVSWSNGLYRLYGYEPGSIPVTFDAGMAHVHPDDRALVAEAVSDAIGRKGAFEIEHRVILIDGSIRTVHAHGSCVQDPPGRVVRMFGTCQDVTEQREVEATLRRAEAKFNRVVENVAEGIVIFDPDGSVAYANPAARVDKTFLGAGAEWMREWQHRVRLRDGAPLGDLRAALQRVLAGEPVEDMELDVEGPDKRRVSLVVNAVPLHDADRAVAVLVSFHDVTALREAEKRVQDLNSHLELKVQEKTELLRHANRELQAFSYTVSHDLQAPLRSIDFIVDRFEQEPAGRGAVNPDALRLVRKEVARMRQLVEDLLDLSRLGTGDIRRTTVDLSAISLEILGTFEREEPTRRVRIEVEPGLVAEADEGLVRVLLANLLANAWKYTRRLKGEARIEVSRGPSGEFRVRDNGVGYDMSRAAGLFQPFVRLHSSAEYEGTGIGLATVQRIVHKHRGRVWGESAPDDGATFSFTLGAGEVAASPAASPSAPAGRINEVAGPSFVQPRGVAQGEPARAEEGVAPREARPSGGAAPAGGRVK